MSLAAALLLACNDDPDNEIEDLADVPSFAVHRSDYMVAAVALLDGDGKLLDESYISSATETAGLNASLHGDIVLPTMPCRADVLAVVARQGGDYVLELDLEEGEVMHQVPTQNSDLSDAAAYRGNPYDMLCLADDLALVPRFDPNLDAGADELDKGDDVIVIDMAEGEIIDRIDLSEVRTPVEGLDSMGEAIEEEALARPTSLVRLGDFAVVGLARLSSGYFGAPGMVGVIDLAERELSSTFEIEGLKNCGSVRPVSGRNDAVLVECSGSPFGDAATAGFALLAIEDGKLKEEAALRDQEAPVLQSGVISLGGTRIVAVAAGDFVKKTNDQAFVVDLETGDRDALFEGEGAGSIGSGAYRAETGLLLIPDSTRGVRVFDVQDGELEARDDIELDPAIPARTVRAIRP